VPNSSNPTGWSAIAGACLVALALPLPALAGSGPWVIADGQYSVYLGGEVSRLERLDTRDGAGNRDVIDVDQGLSTVGAKAIFTVGAQGRFEAEISVPVYRVQANREDGPVCASLGLDACATTQGIGVISARAKGTVLDELYGDPITWAVGADARMGHFTAPTRARITNLGEGTFDLGAFTSIGRGGPLGSGYWSGWIEVDAWYRFANTKAYPAPSGTIAAPQPELQATTEILAGWSPAFSIGPMATVFARPGGLDFGELDFGDPDRLAALRVMNLRVGGTVVVRAREGLSFSGSVLQTVVAANNPYVTVVSFGVGTNGRLTKERD
jgi:hypothetical protein